MFLLLRLNCPLGKFDEITWPEGEQIHDRFAI